MPARRSRNASWGTRRTQCSVRSTATGPARTGDRSWLALARRPPGEHGRNRTPGERVRRAARHLPHSVSSSRSRRPGPRTCCDGPSAGGRGRCGCDRFVRPMTPRWPSCWANCAPRTQRYERRSSKAPAARHSPRGGAAGGRDPTDDAPHGPRRRWRRGVRRPRDRRARLREALGNRALVELVEHDGAVSAVVLTESTCRLAALGRAEPIARRGRLARAHAPPSRGRADVDRRVGATARSRGE